MPNMMKNTPPPSVFQNTKIKSSVIQTRKRQRTDTLILNEYASENVTPKKVKYKINSDNFFTNILLFYSRDLLGHLLLLKLQKMAFALVEMPLII